MHKITRPRLYLGIFFIALLEIVFFSGIKLFGVQPDILLLAVIFFSLFFDRENALEAGLAAGIIRDVLSIGFFGSNAVLFFALAFIASLFRDKIYKDFFLAQICFVAALTALFYLGGFFFKNAASSFALSFPEGLRWVILPAVLYTSIISPPAFFLLDKIFHIRRV